MPRIPLLVVAALLASTASAAPLFHASSGGGLGRVEREAVVEVCSTPGLRLRQFVTIAPAVLSAETLEIAIDGVQHVFRRDPSSKPEGWRSGSWESRERDEGRPSLTVRRSWAGYFVELSLPRGGRFTAVRLDDRSDRYAWAQRVPVPWVCEVGETPEAIAKLKTEVSATTAALTSEAREQCVLLLQAADPALARRVKPS